MPAVRIPTALRPLAGGAAEVGVDGDTVGGILERLDAAHPGFAERLLDEEGNLRRFVNVFVRDTDIRFLDGLATPVGDDDVVSIIPAVAGGARENQTSLRENQTWIPVDGGGERS